jgi:Family of unknown function (DUF6588)
MVCIAIAGPAHAQVDDRLEAYTGKNATGYMAPLVDGFRSNLNSGLFHSARIADGFNISLEFDVAVTLFSEESRMFLATTEGGFKPETTVRAPTVVGDPDAVYVTGDSSLVFAFPGGFDVDHMYLSCPQLRVGTWKGTEVVGRLIIYDTGSTEVGRLGVWGAGMRHSVSQYFPKLAPVDVALAVMWQHAELHNEDDQDVLDSELATVAVHTGVELGSIYPYGGVSISWYTMAIRYGFDDISVEPVELDFNSNADLQLTLGVSYQVGFVAAYGEYNVASEHSVAAGLAVRFPFSNRSVTQ